MQRRSQRSASRSCSVFDPSFPSIAPSSAAPLFSSSPTPPSSSPGSQASWEFAAASWSARPFTRSCAASPSPSCSSCTTNPDHEDKPSKPRRDNLKVKRELIPVFDDEVDAVIKESGSTLKREILFKMSEKDLTSVFKECERVSHLQTPADKAQVRFFQCLLLCMSFLAWALRWRDHRAACHARIA